MKILSKRLVLYNRFDLFLVLVLIEKVGIYIEFVAYDVFAEDVAL
jgi:hypothetical protein